MISEIPIGFLIPVFVFALCSVILCVAQILFRKKVNILSICNVSVFVPLMIMLANVASDTSRALYDTAIANDFSSSVWDIATSRMLAGISLGLNTTFTLLIIYAITKVIYDNQQK